MYYFSAGFYFFSLGEPIHVCLPCVVPLITARAPADWTATESTNGQRIVESMGRHFAAWLPYAGIANGTHRITGRERAWRSALKRLLRPLSKMGTDWPDNRAKRVSSPALARNAHWRFVSTDNKPHLPDYRYFGKSCCRHLLGAKSQGVIASPRPSLRCQVCQ